MTIRVEHSGTQNITKGGLSRFVENAARWRMFDTTVQGIKQRNADQSDANLQTLIDEALDAVMRP